MGFRCRRMLYIAHGQARPGQARAFEAVEVNLEHDILLVEAVLAPSRVARMFASPEIIGPAIAIDAAKAIFGICLCLFICLCFSSAK